ncbi:hypothetical protein Tcan_06723, partial [Toxocara canis]
RIVEKDGSDKPGGSGRHHKYWKGQQAMKPLIEKACRPLEKELDKEDKEAAGDFKSDSTNYNDNPEQVEEGFGETRKNNPERRGQRRRMGTEGETSDCKLGATQTAEKANEQPADQADKSLKLDSGKNFSQPNDPTGFVLKQNTAQDGVNMETAQFGRSSKSLSKRPWKSLKSFHLCSFGCEKLFKLISWKYWPQAQGSVDDSFNLPYAMHDEKGLAYNRIGQLPTIFITRPH